MAASIGAALAFGKGAALAASGWRERRDLYPQGVASGDPDDNSVLLWTRRPYADARTSATLRVEVANVTNRLNVINFAGIFSGTALGAPRSATARLQFVF